MYMATLATKNNHLVSPDELSKMLHRSRVTIWRWIKDDILPSPVRIHGAVLGWKPDVIDQWLDDNSH
jgi:prophage regulatory protein